MEVQPRHVHVHDEALEAPLGRRAVVEVHREQRLAPAPLEDVPPLRTRRHTSRAYVAEGATGYVSTD